MDHILLEDPELARAFLLESDRQMSKLELIASENFVSSAVREAQGSVFTHKYAEGYPGKRYYGGCEFVDIAENLAIERAKQLFGCDYVNVQPHSGSQANMASYFALAKPGDTILGMNLSHGGHLTHGSPVNFSGRLFNVVSYGVDKDTCLINYDEVRRLAHEHRPTVIVAGASAYPRTIDFAKFRAIADEVDAASLAGGTSGTKAGEGVGSGSGLNVRLQSSAKTKAAVEDPLATAKPDKLYGLEIWQYDAGGNFKTGKGVSYTSAVEIGSSFTVTLEALDNCQLVLIARGYNGSAYTVGSLSGKSLSAVQSTTATASMIEGIKNEGDIKAMPYILHLPKVNVTSAGEIQSPDGTDVRILLRRLATRLTLSWKNESEKTGYTLEQVLLQSIPVDYRLLKPVNDDTYPSLLDQYTTIQVASVSDEGSYTCWIPSVVRGESAYASSISTTVAFDGLTSLI